MEISSNESFPKNFHHKVYNPVGLSDRVLLCSPIFPLLRFSNQIRKIMKHLFKLIVYQVSDRESMSGRREK